jgi:hypothetical protein
MEVEGIHIHTALITISLPEYWIVIGQEVYEHGHFKTISFFTQNRKHFGGQNLGVSLNVCPTFHQRIVCMLNAAK